MKLASSAVMLMLVSPVWAQELKPLAQMREEIKGQEVLAEGYLVIPMFMTDIMFRSEAGDTYATKFAVDRELLANVEACVERGECPATLSAELEWRGSDLSLIVFDVQLK